MRAAKKKMAVITPAAAGSMKESNAYCQRTLYARRVSRQVSERALEILMRIFTARSGGAFLCPSDETRMRAYSICPYSERQFVHWLRCWESPCISTPLTAPSRYDENRGRACVHLMTAPPLRAGWDGLPYRFARNSSGGRTVPAVSSRHRA